MIEILKKNLILQFLLIFGIAVIVFYPSFNLALFGDDWLAFWRFNQHLGPKSPGEWNFLTYFLTPYGAQDIIMGTLRNIYGFNSTLYYLTSFVLRMVAAFSLYPLVFYLTKSRLSAFFAVLFFSVTVVGLDATNWVFNMPSYITISLFSLFLFFFLKSRETMDFKTLVLSVVLFYFAYITTPIRMHGSIPLIFLLEAFWVLQNRDLKTLKNAAIRFAMIVVIFLIVKYTGTSLGPPQEIGERFNLGLTAISTLISAGRLDFIFYPFLMLGGMFIPDVIVPQGTNVTSTIKLTFLYLAPSLILYLLFIVLLVKNIPNLYEKFFSKIALTSSLWTIFVAILHKVNRQSFSDLNQIILVLSGGYIIILGLFLLLKYFTKGKIATAIFLSLTWSVLSFFFAWWWVPLSIFPTTYRYLIVSAIGVSVFMGVLISLGKTDKQKRSIAIVMSFFLLITVISSGKYMDYLNKSHSQPITDKIWASIPYNPEIKQNRKQTIYYFEGDTTNGSVLHDVITFGFPPHMNLLYDLREEDAISPIPMSNWVEVVSAAADGQSLKAYGLPAKPFPVEHIYAFHLQGESNLIDVTDLARNKLKEDIKIYLQNPPLKP
jgi:hypothetical protein